MNQRKEILIVGGGVIGVCIAYYLTAEKHDVTLVEKNQTQMQQQSRTGRL